MFQLYWLEKHHGVVPWLEPSLVTSHWSNPPAPFTFLAFRWCLSRICLVRCRLLRSDLCQAQFPVSKLMEVRVHWCRVVILWLSDKIVFSTILSMQYKISACKLGIIRKKLKMLFAHEKSLKTYRWNHILGRKWLLNCVNDLRLNLK